MSWVRENCVSFFELLCIKVVKTGRVPQHIAFIMDGNRRFAKKNSVDSCAGHYKGFDKLSETLKWCLDLGIPEVTVYAFSIENFKRSKEEVDGLMDLARDKFQRLMEELLAFDHHLTQMLSKVMVEDEARLPRSNLSTLDLKTPSDQINEWGVRIHVAGRLSLLPEDLRVLVSKAMLATRYNYKLRLNIAYAYTGRDEISRAASHIVDGVKNKEITPQDIDDELVSRTLELGEAELLVRTSGEVRLSDFMLWQVSNTVLYFTEVLWPEFTVYNLLAAIIHFQRNAPPPKEVVDISGIKKEFLDKMERQRWLQIEKYVSCS